MGSSFCSSITVVGIVVPPIYKYTTESAKSPTNKRITAKDRKDTKGEKPLSPLSFAVKNTPSGRDGPYAR
jgi:hypothetical protein